MKNRVSTYPGRVKLTPVDAANGIYDMIRADEPTDEGTPLNKALLDYAVAACGVTGGTSTAYTLNDTFGGFALVDGAKVNMRLHVASGANPTLNVNGTGAKPLRAADGGTFPPNIPDGKWVTAAYNASADTFDADTVSVKRWITCLSQNATSVKIDLPAEYKLFRLRGTLLFGDDNTRSYIYIRTGVSMHISSGGATRNETIGSARSNMNPVYAGATASYPSAGVDFTIYTEKSKTVLSGIIYGGYGIEGVGINASQRINYIQISRYDGTIWDGSSMILEAMA